MQSYQYVIVGGGLAGGRACQGIRRLDKEGSVALISAEAHLPYERPALSKGYMTGKEDLDHLYVKEADYYEKNQIDLLTGVRVTGIDRKAHSVTLDDGRVLGYGKLLLATGSTARRLSLPGAGLAGVYTLRTIEDSQAIQAAAKAAGAAIGKRALVLGGSFVGSEVAASLAQLGAQVTMVFPESRLLKRVVTKEYSAYLANVYAAHGVRILSGIKPERLQGTGHVERVVLDNAETLEVDLVVMGVGVRPDTALAVQAGLEMTDQGGVLVDELLRTSDPDIYAAGDIAAWMEPTFGKRMRVEHWDVAFRQGLRAGRNMAGEAKSYATLPYFFSDLFDLSFEVWGDLSAWDQTVQRGALPALGAAGSGSYAFYYFDRGILTGVLAVGRPKAERKPMPALVEAGPAYADVAAKLADEATDLAELID